MELINLEQAIKLRNKLQKEGKVLPATKDIIFKNVMKKCPNYLSSILEYFIDYDKEIIKKNMYLENVEMPLSNIKEKNKTADIIIRIGNNVINLEMNAKNYPGLRDRNVSYISKAKGEASFNGESYIVVYKAIQINFDLDWQYDDRDIIKFLITDTEKGIVETENYQIYHINLLKLKEKYYNRSELNRFERAITLLALDKKDDLEKISKGDDSLMEAKEEIEKLSDNLGIIGVYDYQKYKEWEWQQLAKQSVEEDVNRLNVEKEIFQNEKNSFQNEKNSFQNEKNSFQNEKNSFQNEKKLMAEEKELIKKERESIEKEKNKIKKAKELEVKKKIVKNLISMNLKVEDIIKATNLTKEEIENLKSQ